MAPKMVVIRMVPLQALEMFGYVAESSCFRYLPVPAFQFLVE